MFDLLENRPCADSSVRNYQLTAGEQGVEKPEKRCAKVTKSVVKCNGKMATPSRLSSLAAWNPRQSQEQKGMRAFCAEKTAFVRYGIGGSAQTASTWEPVW
jgi:hypothetical protein